MSKLFKELVNSNLITDWAETLDWLFDDDKFSQTRGWNGGYTGQFTKKLQKLDGFSKDRTFLIGAAKNLAFPQKGAKKKMPYAVFAEGDSTARDFVRHVRNGIAHGLTDTYKNEKGELYIEIIDYDSKGKKHQTAYFAIPISYITQSYKIYREVEKSIRNTKEKDRKLRGKRHA